MENKKDKETIKDYYGEEMWKLARELFPTILDRGDGILSKILLKNFAPSRALAKALKADFCNCEDFKAYIYSKYYSDEEDTALLDTKKSPEELMKEAGYILFPEVQTSEELLTYRKYYRADEELCSFARDGERIKYCRIWFAVKENYDQIKRQRTPSRQDEYGTSVISIQFTRGKKSTLSIKNRYNDHVQNADATFSNDLENIIPGLTKAFCNFKKIDMKKGDTSFSLSEYILAKDGKYYKSNLECGGFHFCENNIVVDKDKNIKVYNKSKYLLVENYLLDLEKKRIINLADKEDESFSNAIGEIDKIAIYKQIGSKLIEIKPKKGYTVKLEINNLNQIISYYNKNVVDIEDNFMKYNNYLQKLEMPNVETIGKNCLLSVKNIKALKFPKLRRLQECSFYKCNELEELDIPNLEEIEGRCFYSCNKLKEVKLNKLKILSDFCFYECEKLENIEMEQNETIQDFCFYNCRNLKKVSLENNKTINDRCFNNCCELLEVYAPKNEIIREWCFYFCDKLQKIYMPNNIEMQKFAFHNACSLEELELENNKMIGYYCFTETKKLKKLYLPNNEYIGDECFLDSNELKEINLDNNLRTGDLCFKRANSLEMLYLPKNTKIGDQNFEDANNLKKIHLAKNQFIGRCSFKNCAALEKIELPVNIQIAPECFYNIKKDAAVNVPKNKCQGKDCFNSLSKEEQDDLKEM